MNLYGTRHFEIFKLHWQKFEKLNQNRLLQLRCKSSCKLKLSLLQLQVEPYTKFSRTLARFRKYRKCFFENLMRLIL